jgi:hypothetical protein
LAAMPLPIMPSPIKPTRIFPSEIRIDQPIGWECGRFGAHSASGSAVADRRRAQ